MSGSNRVFIATSMDGYIADRNDGLEWLDSFPEINTIDTGYDAFMAGIDALLMGRRTFDVVCNFEGDWPYTKPVFVASHTMQKVPEELVGRVVLVRGNPKQMVQSIHQKGYSNLYIDGGKLVQEFLRADLLDSMIITKIPILLGGGIPLFGELEKPIKFVCTQTKHFLGKIAQSHYTRMK